jgi:hypothetical protein
MGKPSDRNNQYMKEMWGTTELITDYDNTLDKKLLQEVNYDDSKVITEKDCRCKNQFSSSFLTE